MPEGAKGRWQALRRQSAALSVVMALGYGGNALAQTTNSQPAQPVPSHEKKPVRPKVEKVEKTRAEGLLGQPVLDAKRQSIGHVVN
ncbi:MAG: hypothetical protein ACREFS_07300, partial [Acetobacteraceae bacterium]